MAITSIPGTLLTATNVWQQVFFASTSARLFFLQNLHMNLAVEVVFGPDPDVSLNDPTFILGAGQQVLHTSRVLGTFAGEVWVRAVMGNVDMLVWELIF